MGRDLTPNEIEEGVTTARMTSTVISEGEYPSVAELHGRLKESGYLEAVRGLAQMERELGVPATQAVARYQEIVARLPELEAQEAQAVKRKAEADRAAAEAQKRATAERAAANAAQVERQRLQRELAAFVQQCNRERERLEAEVQLARKKAAMDREQVAIASDLKRQIEARGLRLGFVLDLMKEVPDDEDARERLSIAIEEHGTLQQAIAVSREEKDSVEGEIAALIDEKVGLDEKRQGLKAELTGLRADIKHDRYLREFHGRFQQIAPLMEYISTWGPLIICRAQLLMSPVYRVVMVNGTPLPSPFGPGTSWLWDTEAYKALGLSPGPVRLGL